MSFLYVQQCAIILHVEWVDDAISMFMKFLLVLMGKISYGLLDYIKHIFLHLLDISCSVFFLKWCITLITILMLSQSCIPGVIPYGYDISFHTLLQLVSSIFLVILICFFILHFCLAYYRGN